MAGDEQVRFCEHCEKSVHDLSAMTRKRALRLVRASGGALCVRFHTDPHGRSLHRPEGKLHSITRRASAFAAGAFGAFVALGSTALAQTPSPDARRDVAAARLAARSESEEKQAKEEEKGEAKEAPACAVNAGDATFAVTPDTQAITQLPLRPENDPRTTMTVTMGMIAVIRPDDPLVRAVAERDTRAAKNLIALGADVNVLDKSAHTTALMQAVSNNDAEMVSALIAAGADVNMKDTDGDTALTSLGEGATVEMARALIRAGAKVNHKNDYGETPLIGAAENDTPEVLKELLEAGAKVNAKNKSGRTALMAAAEYGLMENIKLLLDAGADVNLKDRDDTTALKLAKDYGAEESDDSEEAEEPNQSAQSAQSHQSNQSKKDKEPKESEESKLSKKIVTLLVSYGAIE
jgi:ankyrin repeat protein